MKKVYIVRGINVVDYVQDVLAVFGREDAAQAFIGHYREQARATYDCCADENEFLLYDRYEVVEQEVQ